MTLTLPADAERHLPDDAGYDHLRTPGVYALICDKPGGVEAAWTEQFDNLPEYIGDLKQCCRVVYVGESGDVLRGLEQHRDAEKKKARLLEVWPPRGILDIKWCDSKHKAELLESRLAIQMQNSNPDWYVHSR